MSGFRPCAFVVLAGLAAPLLVAGSADAQSVYDTLFGRPTAPARSPGFFVPAPAPQPFFPVDPEPRRRSAPDARPRVSVEVPPPPVMPVKAKPARAASDKEIVASVLADSTLQKGDIVVFPDGPRVYRGNGGFSHKVSDFEDLRSSRMVDDGTRKTVLASTRTTTFTKVNIAAAPKSRSARRAPPSDVASTGSVAVSAR